ncbi:hypothetical protein TWF694_011248 [Orbilia ellipsospora]|uniref:Uncharacterized protein n=1 Tax=Orbilia ellipsospora TaxID=2528407 RepID=A0AAV9XEU1_9PEZI
MSRPRETSLWKDGKCTWRPGGTNVDLSTLQPEFRQMYYELSPFDIQRLAWIMELWTDGAEKLLGLIHARRDPGDAEFAELLFVVSGIPMFTLEKFGPFPAMQLIVREAEELKSIPEKAVIALEKRRQIRNVIKEMDKDWSLFVTALVNERDGIFRSSNVAINAPTRPAPAQPAPVVNNNFNTYNTSIVNNTTNNSYINYPPMYPPCAPVATDTTTTTHQTYSNQANQYNQTNQVDQNNQFNQPNFVNQPNFNNFTSQPGFTNGFNQGNFTQQSNFHQQPNFTNQPAFNNQANFINQPNPTHQQNFINQPTFTNYINSAPTPVTFPALPPPPLPPAPSVPAVPTFFSTGIAQPPRPPTAAPPSVSTTIAQRLQYTTTNRGPTTLVRERPTTHRSAPKLQLREVSSDDSSSSSENQYYEYRRHSSSTPNHGVVTCTHMPRERRPRLREAKHVRFKVD